MAALTILEAARRRGVTKQCMYDLAERGIVRATPTGPSGQYVIDEAEVARYEAWRAQGRHGPPVCPDDLTLDMVAAHLGRSRSTIYHYLTAGRLRGHRHGHWRWAVRARDLAAFQRVHTGLTPPKARGPVPERSQAHGHSAAQ